MSRDVGEAIVYVLETLILEGSDQVKFWTFVWGTKDFLWKLLVFGRVRALRILLIYYCSENVLVDDQCDMNKYMKKKTSNKKKENQK